MSTALATLRQELKQQLAQQKAALPPPTSPSIRVTQDKKFEFPDGTRTDKPFNAVILDWRYVNAYYKNAWRPGVVETPECWSVGADANTMTPNEASAKPKHTDCDGCPMNQWGSGQGGKGKACGNKVRVALAPPDANEKTPVYIITVSPTGYNPFNKMIAALINRGTPPITVTSAVGFDPDKAFASVRFTPGEEHDNLEAMLKLKEKAQDLLNRGFDFD
jgi:hypothetical protein